MEAAAALLLLAGCVDPKQDLDDWEARIADSQGSVGPVVEAGGTDSALPDASFGGTYLMACLSSLNPNPTQALLFKADARFTPSAGGGGTFDFTQTPLLKGATDITQLAPMGVPVMVPASAVAADGTCDVHIGPTTIPASADPVGPQIVFADSLLHFHLSANPICASLSGQVTAPLMQTVDPAHSFCVLSPPTPPFPTFTASHFHCP